MAVNVTVVPTGAYSFVADIEATADGDTVTGVIPHGLGAAPTIVALANLQQAAAALSAWAVTTIDAVNIELTKSVAVGSGAVGDQVRVSVMLPHSIVS